MTGHRAGPANRKSPTDFNSFLVKDIKTKPRAECLAGKKTKRDRHGFDSFLKEKKPKAALTQFDAFLKSQVNEAGEEQPISQQGADKNDLPRDDQASCMPSDMTIQLSKGHHVSRLPHCTPLSQGTQRACMCLALIPTRCVDATLQVHAERELYSNAIPRKEGTLCPTCLKAVLAISKVLLAIIND